MPKHGTANIPKRGGLRPSYVRVCLKIKRRVPGPHRLLSGHPCTGNVGVVGNEFRPTSVRGRTPHSFPSQLKFVNRRNIQGTRASVPLALASTGCRGGGGLFIWVCTAPPPRGWGGCGCQRCSERPCATQRHHRPRWSKCGCGPQNKLLPRPRLRRSRGRVYVAPVGSFCREHLRTVVPGAGL